MSTLSVPVPPHLEEFINKQIKMGKSPNKAAVVRKALQLLSEEEAIRDVLEAEQEVTAGKVLKGDLRKLLKKFS